MSSQEENEDDLTKLADASALMGQVMHTEALEPWKSCATSTRKAYEPKIEEFKSWCDKTSKLEKPNRYFVHEESVVAFLQAEVIGRNYKKAKVNRKIGGSCVSQYVNALIDLFKHQRRQGLHNHCSPRKGKALQELLDAFKGESLRRKKRKYDVYEKDQEIYKIFSDEEKRKLEGYYLNILSGTWAGLRDYMAISTMRAMALRGKEMREVVLSDLVLHEIETEGRSYPAIMILLKHGQTNSHGKIEVTGASRSEKALWCAHGTLAMWLFYRFDVCSNGFPPLDESKDWKDIKLFPKKLEEPKGEICRSTHIKAFTRAFKLNGIDLAKLTPVLRGNGAKAQRLKVVPADRVHLGRSKQDKASSVELCESVLGALPEVSLYIRSSSVERDQMQVPAVLLKQVFPQVERLLREEKQKRSEDQDVAKLRFLEFLRYLRKVLIQDACFLIDKYPKLPIWKTALFRSSEFVAFKRRMDAFVCTIANPSTSNVMEAAIHKLSGEIATLKDAVQTISSKMEMVVNQVNALSKGEKPHALVLDTSTTEHAESLTERKSEKANSIYKMSRDNITVHDLWKEWTQGINGMKSIEYLEENRIRWRTSSSEKTFYCRRKKLIHCIKTCAQVKHIPLIDAVKLMENYREHNNKTLDWLSKHIEDVKQRLCT